MLFNDFTLCLLVLMTFIYLFLHFTVFLVTFNYYTNSVVGTYGSSLLPGIVLAMQTGNVVEWQDVDE